MHKVNRKKPLKTSVMALFLLAITLMVASGKMQSITSTKTATHGIITVQPTSTATTIYVDPPTITAEVSQKFLINISISDVTDLYGWEFKLRWNPALLEALNITEGSFLKSYSDTFFAININNTEGTLKAVCTLMGSIPGVNGSGTLATVEFEIENEGECILNLFDTKLVNSAVQSIEHTVIDGYFSTPVDIHDIAVIDINVSPTIVLPGAIVKINATVQNQGDFPEEFNVTAYSNSEVIGVQNVSLDTGALTTIAFTWNTTDHGKGDYTISALASIVLGEIDTTNNYKVADDGVTILYDGHDVAVVNVEPLKTVIAEKYCMNIVVTVKNYGTFNETFDTAVFANTTDIGTQTAILISGESGKLTFTWNTTGFALGNYTLWAYAEPVSGDTNTDDNTFVDGWVFVAGPGDVNADGEVDIFDLVTVALALGSVPGDDNWNPNSDINNDQLIDIFDLVAIAVNIGQTYTYP